MKTGTKDAGQNGRGTYYAANQEEVVTVLKYTPLDEITINYRGSKRLFKREDVKGTGATSWVEQQNGSRTPLLRIE
jgi:hypothetical protein